MQLSKEEKVNEKRKGKSIPDISGNSDRRYLLLCDDTGDQHSCFRFLDIYSERDRFIIGSLRDKDAVHQLSGSKKKQGVQNRRYSVCSTGDCFCSGKYFILTNCKCKKISESSYN